jgi:hypothetical protein
MAQKHHFQIALVVCLFACRRDRPFTTLATYDAPKSGFRLVVDATGIVPPDEDLATGVPAVAIVCPKSSAAHALRIDVSGPKATVTDGAKTTVIPWNAPAFTRALIDAGYSIDAAEIDESLGAVEGVSEGPKATRMPGQTRALAVVNVDFSAHAPASVGHCP